MAREDDRQPFKVTDRRGRDDAEPAQDAPSATQATPGAPPEGDGAPAAPEASERARQEVSERAYERAHSAQGPAIDFMTFVLSLNTSALIHLGVMAIEGEDPAPNLPLAQQSIDCLAMLEDKTRGNLTGEEERLLTQVLYDLRLRYVHARKASG